MSCPRNRKLMMRKERNLGCGQSTEHQGKTAIVHNPASLAGFLCGHLGVELGEPGLCGAIPLTPEPSVLNRSPHIFILQGILALCRCSC